MCEQELQRLFDSIIVQNINLTKLHKNLTNDIMDLPDDYDILTYFRRFIEAGGIEYFNLIKIGDVAAINNLKINKGIQHPVTGNTIAHENYKLFKQIWMPFEAYKEIIDTKNYNGVLPVNMLQNRPTDPNMQL